MRLVVVYVEERKDAYEAFRVIQSSISWTSALSVFACTLLRGTKQHLQCMSQGFARASVGAHIPSGDVGSFFF
jgi:hypothetical protein